MLIAITFPFWAGASVPYSGKVAINGINFNGDAQFAFSLINGNGITHWSNGKHAGDTIKLTVTNGRYRVLLGGQGMNTLPPEIFLKHNQLYLKVEFDNGDGKGLRHLSPDQLITATPRALMAEWAKMAEGVSLGAITRDMLSSDILDDINQTITFDRLAPSAINAISSSSLSSITDGKIKVVPFGQTPPSGYSLYHRGKAENIDWQFLNFNNNTYSFNYLVNKGSRFYLVGVNKIFEQQKAPAPWKENLIFDTKINGHSVAIQESQIYIVAGKIQSGNKTSMVRVFDIEKNTITQTSPLPINLEQATAKSYFGKIVVMGGWTEGSINSSAFEFDPVSQKWDQKEKMKIPRALMASTIFHNKIWLAGGNGHNSELGKVSAVSSVESYDPINHKWTIESSMLQARRCCSIWTFNNRIFVAGGYDENGQLLDSIEFYDPNLKVWNEWGKLPMPISNAAAVILDDVVYILSGEGNKGIISLNMRNATLHFNDIYIQDLNTSSQLEAGLADGAVTAIKMAEGAVTASKIANNSITTAQLNEQILRYLKPEITLQPQCPKLIFSGQSMNLTSQAQGKFLTYQWQRNGQPLAGATQPSLSITEVKGSLHDGNYSVVVSNDFGSVTSALSSLQVDTTPSAYTVASIGMEMIFCPPGSFTMGSPASEAGRGTDEVQHQVTLTNGFYLGKYEVTQAQYETVMNGNSEGLSTSPSSFNGSNRPVERVSWEDAQIFLTRLNSIEQSAGRLPAGWKYGLPTEAEWEYACRAGTTTAYSWGHDINSTRANYNWDGGANDGNDSKQTVEIRQFSANPWGFFDMHGNVWEWVRNWKANYPGGAQTDPKGPDSGSIRVTRGGAWYTIGTNLRSAHRGSFYPSYRTYVIGFRVRFQKE